jgi:hypothetical protein
MWKCTNCHHVEFSTDKPPQCPVCGAQSEKLVLYDAPGIKGTKTLNNLKAGFVSESQAHLRNLAFAMKAEQESYSLLYRTRKITLKVLLRGRTSPPIPILYSLKRPMRKGIRVWQRLSGIPAMWRKDMLTFTRRH